MLVIDIYFEQLSRTGEIIGHEIEVGTRCGYEARLTFTQFDICHFKTAIAHADDAVATKTDVYDKRVVLEEFSMERPRDIMHLHREVWTFGDGYRLVDFLKILCLIGWIESVVDCIDGQLGMQLSRTSVETGTVVIEYAIGDVATLLHFGKIYTTANGMNPAGRNEEDIASFHRMTLQHFAYAAIFHSFLIFVFAYCLIES